jgi:hypothetical protein
MIYVRAAGALVNLSKADFSVGYTTTPFDNAIK